MGRFPESSSMSPGLKNPGTRKSRTDVREKLEEIFRSTAGHAMNAINIFPVPRQSFIIT